MGIESDAGFAYVTAIEPCPRIASGDGKETWGAGKEQVRNVWSNIACWNLNAWLYALVEGGSVRKVTIDTTSELYRAIGAIDKKYQASGRAFFTACSIRRIYKKLEIEAASLFQVKIERVFEPAGDSARTRYLLAIGLVATLFLTIRANRLGIPAVMQKNVAIIASSSNPAPPLQTAFFPWENSGFETTLATHRTTHQGAMQRTGRRSTCRHGQAWIGTNSKGTVAADSGELPAFHLVRRNQASCS